jgi:hypothetical protein
VTAIFAGDRPPQSKIVSLSVNLLSYEELRQLIYDGSYEVIVFDQELGIILENMKKDLSKGSNNQDPQEFKRQTAASCWSRSNLRGPLTYAPLVF